MIRTPHLCSRNPRMYIEENPEMDMQAYWKSPGWMSGPTIVPTNPARKTFVRNIMNLNGAPFEYL